MSGSLERALNCLGKGFDVTLDFQAEHCRGKERLIVLNEEEKAVLSVPGFGSVLDVSADIKWGKGDRIRHQSNALDFDQMSELFNLRCSLGGRIPSGHFNYMFGFNGGSWAQDASETKFLAMDGYFISLFSLHIDRHPLSLSDHVINDVPSTWDPIALARFIENFGTHIIVGMSLGGQDVMYMRQHHHSNLSASEIKQHLDKLADQLFTGTSMLPLHWKSKDHEREGLTVMCSKRGGDIMASSHREWLRTVHSMPDIINFTFVPITSLLKGIPGISFLTHAINLYLRYKPPMSDLPFFLDFQSYKAWGSHSEDSVTQRPPSDLQYFLDLQSYSAYTTSWAYDTSPSSYHSSNTAALQFSPMGPKLYVNMTQVIVGRHPVTGMRLQLEGKKDNRLAIHLQHLSNIPSFIENCPETSAPSWRGSKWIDYEIFYEPVQWKKFSNVCTAVMDMEEDPSPGASASIVTGAQLHVSTTNKSTRLLHLSLLYSEMPGFVISQSKWELSGFSRNKRSSFLSSATDFLDSDKEIQQQQKKLVNMDSGVLTAEPQVQAQKFLKFVDTSDICKGPQDSPGYWLVTGAKLDVINGKIGLAVQFSLISLAPSPAESEAA